MKPDSLVDRDLRIKAMEITATLGERLRELGVRCKLSDMLVPARIGYVDREMGLYDHQMMIDPEDPHWLDKATGFILQAGNDLTFAALELPNGVESAHRITDRHHGLSLRAVRAYDMLQGKLVTRIDGLFKVNAAA
jgi:hypothetical protein